jgi:hypothetical protein
MSEDRLERALEAIKSEGVNPEELAAARARVWEKLDNPGAAVCAEFRLQFHDYLEGRLAGNRKLLIEDHLSRCPLCREQLAAQKGELKVIPMPRRRAFWQPRWGAWAAAAALILGALYLGRNTIDTLLAPRGPRATVASVSGGLYLVPEGVLKTGSAIGENEVIRTGPGAHALLRLNDGSLVDVNERTELSVQAAWSGRSIRLQRGDIIVRAAKQHRGHLRVQTRDSVASVKGTVFAVSAGLSGTLVSVVEGSVAVTQQSVEVVLGAGEQAASNPALTGSVQNAISWSPDAETYLATLASLAQVEKQIAQLPSPSLRTESGLIQYMPEGMVVYGAVPNLTGTIGQAMALAEQQSAENPAFSQWWDSGPGRDLNQLISRIQTVTPLLGEEIVYGCATGATGTAETIPMILAEVQPGKRAELAAVLDGLGIGTSQSPVPYNLTDTVLTVSDSQIHLQWLLDHMGQGASTSFAAAIAARYKDGAGWLLGVDMESLLSSRETIGTEFMNAQQMKHVFLEQRKSSGAEENEIAVTFKGPRVGLASWLASSGSGGAAEYLSSDAVAAIYVSTREPQQLIEELIAQLSQTEPMLQSNLAQAEEKLGISLTNDLARAFGTESAFALEGFSITGPVWVLAALVNDPPTLETSIRRLVDISNAELARTGQTGQIYIDREVVDGREWTALTFASSKLSVTWTYDRGYLVAGSDRGAVIRALGIRNGGSPLIWSTTFQQQLPASTGLHPSGFAWLNTKGALQNLAVLIPSPAIQKLVAERDPILVIFDGATEQIRAVSRTRLSGLLMNVALLQGLGRTSSESQSSILRQ